MKFAARINSYTANDGLSVEDAIKKISEIKDFTHVDLNYPEHFSGKNMQEMKQILKNNGIKLNGIALRFRNEYINGELGNNDSTVSQKAIQLCKEAIDACKKLDGHIVTIWLGYDGFDYCFQIDYAKVWNQVSEAFKEICSYDPEMMISIEYKPFQPRVYSLISDFGSTMTMINDTGCSNLGVTLDFCHMLMSGENPAFGAALLGEKGKLYGIHLNDGNKLNDDGLMVGMVNFFQTLEFIYYIKKYKYDGVIYFDTFPIREDSTMESIANVTMLKKIDSIIDNLGMDKIHDIIQSNDAIAVHAMLLECFS